MLNRMSYHLGLIGDQGTRRWHDLRPCYLAHAHSTLQKPSYHVHSVIGERAVLLMQAVDDASDPASRVDHFDVCFDELPELLRDCFGGDT